MVNSQTKQIRNNSKKFEIFTYVTYNKPVGCAKLHNVAFKAVERVIKLC